LNQFYMLIGMIKSKETGNLYVAIKELGDRIHIDPVLFSLKYLNV
jgi:hypothetical protein